MSATLPHAPGEHGEPPLRGPQPDLLYYPRRVLKALASLQLTVGLFALAIALVFFGTLAQIDYGIWTVVDKYFASWVVSVPTDLFRKFLNVFWKEAFPPESSPWTATFPFPAGYLIGVAMIVNLLAAHALRFRLTWKRSGIFLIHSGIVLLFVGEFVTRQFAVEQQMRIDEGSSAAFTLDTRNVELAFVDATGSPTEDRVAVVAQKRLRASPGARIRHPDLPADVELVQFMKNSNFAKPGEGGDNRATAGFGLQTIIVEVGEESGVALKQRGEAASAYVKLYKKGTDDLLGVYVFSQLLKDQTVELDGKPYQVSLRYAHYYKPYRIHLDKFSFDRYTGTQKAKNFSSDVRVYEGDNPNPVVTTRIAMNEPLRYAGETFYQADYDHDTEKATVLQVVKNPGMLNFGLFYASIDYIACAVVTFGLLLHFNIYLVQFLLRKTQRLGETLTKRAVAEPVAPTEPAAPPLVVSESFAASRNFPWAMLGLAVLVLLMGFARMNPPSKPYNLEAVGRLHVVDGGRDKPLDTVARVNLRVISGREEWEDESGKMQPAIRWYLDVLSGGNLGPSSPAWKHKVIRIDNEEVMKALKLKPVSGLRYSLDEVAPGFPTIMQRAAAAEAKVKGGGKLDTTESKFKELVERLNTISQIATEHVQHGALLIPPAASAGWESLGKVRQDAEMRAKRELRDEFKLTEEMIAKLDKQQQKELNDRLTVELARREKKVLDENPAAANWDRLLTAWREKKPDEFNAAVDEYRTVHAANVSDKRPGKNLLEKVLYAPFNAVGMMRVEAMYNRFAPFYQCTGLYVFAFVLAVVGYFLSVAEKPHWATGLRRSAFFVLLLTLAVHTLALLTRMYVMDRAAVFVTNLYSSAIFIGWGCVALCLVLERVFPIGIGNAVAGLLGLLTCIVAHNIASEDTLEMMQAVLDTNFWLATHVTTVTLGYTATFVAGFLGALYVEQMLATVIRDSFRSTGEPTVGALLAFGAAVVGSVGIVLAPAWTVAATIDGFDWAPSALVWGVFYLLAAAGAVYALVLLLLRVSSEGVDANGKPLAGQVPPLAKPLVGAALTPESSKLMGQMIYGVLCFATLLSFVGTVLGGIWADQSWGRFWGWDPKENGAVLIVLWNSLILHARWCGLVKERGMAALALFGNAITAWSWFGTNQLGLGLHAYGFDTRLADGCFNFWLSQLAILAVGAAIPRRFWASATRAGAAALAPAVTSAIPLTPPAAPTNNASAPTSNGVPPSANGNGHSRRDKGKKYGKRR